MLRIINSSGNKIRIARHSPFSFPTKQLSKYGKNTTSVERSVPSLGQHIDGEHLNEPIILVTRTNKVVGFNKVPLYAENAELPAPSTFAAS